MDRTRNMGKLGIVTGAGSGIGRATALRLAVELVTADVTTQKVAP
jgi:NAD(P)-dependent dehydrogenase (short-subunit alcohol dehydrogenase family)